ncbi:hypothetical protein [Paenibacillus sp. P36]|uniref:hypothetical protein n=1 Tax=Paenibacillus sp. P36 TaxID=3342538 RepID=UPI0038B3284B
MILMDNDLWLRPIIIPNDIETAVSWYQNPEVLYYSEGGEASTPYDFERVEVMYSFLSNKAEIYIIEINTIDGWLPIGDVSLFQESGVLIVIGNSAYRSSGIGNELSN